MSMAYASSLDKGLANRAGANNCFLNVVIQSLWHLDSFRQRFFQWTEKHHTHKSSHSCVFCALSVVFTQYAFCEEEYIPPDALRIALDLIYKDSRRFQMGDLDDAAEALDAVLTCLETDMEKTKKDLEMKKAEELFRLPHVAFGLTITEQVRCERGCKAAAEAMTSSSFIFYTYSSSLIRFHQNYPHLSFGQLLYAISDEDMKSCPSEGSCPAKCGVYRHLMHQPDIFTVDIVWESPNPDIADITKTTQLIPIELDLSHVFPSVRFKAPYILRGMICYYGKHYNAYFYSYSKRQWLVYDDSRVIPVAHSWAEIQERCRRGRFQASVLFYETAKPTQKLDPPDIWTPTVVKDEPPPPYVEDDEPPPSYGDHQELPPSYESLSSQQPTHKPLVSSMPFTPPPGYTPLLMTPAPSSPFPPPSPSPSPPPSAPIPGHRVSPMSTFSAFKRVYPTRGFQSYPPPSPIFVPRVAPIFSPFPPSSSSSPQISAPLQSMGGAPTLPPSAAPMLVPISRQPVVSPSAPPPVSTPPVQRAPLPSVSVPTFSPVPSAPMDQQEFAKILAPTGTLGTLRSLEKRVESNPNYTEALFSTPSFSPAPTDSPFQSSVLMRASQETSFLSKEAYHQLNQTLPLPSAPPL